MKRRWELRYEDNHWAAAASATIVAVLSAFIYAFFSQADPGFATSFSSAFLLSADLGKCSSSFSAIVMAQIVYSIVVTLLLVSIAGRCVFGAITDAGSRKSFLWIAVGALLFGGFLIGIATAENGWWFSGSRRSINRALSFQQACLNSHQILYPQLYLMSIWLAGITWMALLMLLTLTRKAAYHREYEDLPRDPQLREEILRIRAKYPPIHLTKAKKILGMVGIVIVIGCCLVGLAHGLYKAGIAFELLALGR
ncbi:hypothetical protein P9272_18410 [Mesorhizobium sp. WSM4976]|uniref:hypothetical protein n=1 Tax=Mesorhizobium sp. WSM4976 TaxID=3038549 RepID=UPI002417A6F5|nr:hypothetical protein [Mesorhizobium sp. WSM4976]MDG4895546.1 hypothetical protein [Mesorhizobium sp. WSM4976]